MLVKQFYTNPQAFTKYIGTLVISRFIVQALSTYCH